MNNKRTEPAFELTMQVRDYECDLQGIVNNAVYQHYIEHTRSEFLKSEGVSFSRLHEQGIDTVVARLAMEFKSPLRPDDTFLSCLNVEKQGIRYVFHQDLYRLPDHRHALHADVTIVCLIDGRPHDCELINSVFAKYLF